MKPIDNLLNRITMYKLVLYCLVAWLVIAVVLGYFHLLPYAPEAILFSTAVFLAISWLTNRLFTLVFKTQANTESVYITALILALIISPPFSGQFESIMPFLIWASIWSMASKFIMAINKKHIFNPAALAIALTALTLNQSATWWIGTLYMLPFVIIGGFLIVRKIRRGDLVLSFFVTAMITIFITMNRSAGIGSGLEKVFVESPIIFFATVMLTEPLTTPPNRWSRILYGALIGILFAPNLHFGSFYGTPELALLAGNVLSFALSPKRKYVLTLKSKAKIASGTGEFVFTSDRPVKFKPGQYLEWTLAHGWPDSRGNRRYFTIASSPTEKDVRMGVKFDSKNSSSFKKNLAELPEGATIMAGQLAGDFILPKNADKKLCFIAGGIGFTPFRSMIQYMIDKNQRRDVIVVYSVKKQSELAYMDLLDQARQRIGLKTVVTISDLKTISPDWNGHRGYVDAAMIAAEVPDYNERLFYISGPNSLVKACKDTLSNLDVRKSHIKSDYFPGFA